MSKFDDPGTYPSKFANFFQNMYLLIGCRESTPPQNRQLIVHYYLLRYEVDGFVREFDFLKLMNEYIVSDTT